MAQYVVRGVTRGLLYAGQSLDAALETLRLDKYQCRVEHGGPSDARLSRDGVLVATELRADGTVGIAEKRAPVALPPSEMPAQYPRHVR